MNTLNWLQEWYRRQANGEWEHQHGIAIETTDNPGWKVDIDLAETRLASERWSRVEIERTDSDWIHSWVENEKFKIACGPTNLDEALNIFRRWVEMPEMNCGQLGS